MKSLCLIVFIMISWHVGCGCKSSSTKPESEGEVIFYDEFDTFNLSTWQHEITAGGGGNFEFQYYTNNRSNSYVRDGILYIKPTLTSDKYGEEFIKTGTLDLEGSYPANQCTGRQWYGCNRVGNYDAGYIVNPIQSARIRTVNSFSFTYGRVEVEAQMPKGDWIWPAIWLLPTNNAYGDWPASGEIDLLEGRGNMNLTNSEGHLIGAQSVGCTLHWGPHWPHNAWYLTHADQILTNGESFADDFHKFAVEWTKDKITFEIDGNILLESSPPDGKTMYEWGEFSKDTGNQDNPWVAGTKLAPFDQDFYILINVAVGGTNGYFTDDATNYPYSKPWANGSPTGMKDFYDKKDEWYPTWNGEDSAMKVKYIKVTSIQENFS